jgi:hypothetical protein
MDWVALLDAQGIEYVTSGPNTRKGQISIRCPFCTDDPSEHLSIALNKDAYGCWRDSRHSGRKPYPLIAALLNCSFSQAKLIQQQFSTPDPESFEGLMTALGSPIMPAEQPKLPQGLPASFQPIKPTGLTRRFWQYLERRGFDDVGKLARQYGLLCAQTGEMKDRVILPLYSAGKLIGWTARAIQKTINAPRYLTSSSLVKSTIFNEDDLDGGQHLLITEGPFDALKVDYYGKPRIRATCLYGVVPIIPQISILRQIIKRFNYTSILFDNGALDQAMTLRDYLPSGVGISVLPDGAKDPGELTKQQVVSLT